MIVEIYESFQKTGMLNLVTLEAKGEGINLLEKIKSESIIYSGDKKPILLSDKDVAMKLGNTFDNAYYLVVAKS